jgi:hypothetical protein
MSASRTSSLMPVPPMPAAEDTVVSWAGAPDARSVLLRNSGSRPLRVRGELIAEGSSWAMGNPCWHELSLYRCEGGQIAIAQRTRHQSAPEGGLHRAVLRADMEETCAWLEAFDASADLDAGFDVADMNTSTATIGLKAAALRDRADRVVREYRCLVGELLDRLAAEP